ncbi:GNAT family N-acetyltransferase [Acrocarpospora macrocephala]|uniref:UPF0256 protein n=1 Tax=Acrocarpospora macrocephala TaxID=150177 RepID=A0A5M3X038_9ACTN|nr:GNAT family N-acetyltransferase [Acrocarpospora macrocephala]GES15125.1 UPF0256 protein [Acrocarpospora macrocephala]
MNHPIRPISEAEWPAFIAVLEEAFAVTFHPVEIERFKALTPMERTLAAFDADLPVGVTAIFDFDMTIPGGTRLPVAGVTAVSVLPSHRRRGILNSLMRRQLQDIKESGQSIAVLYASEAGIYGRFGYGRAADTVFFRIPKHGSAFVKNAPTDPALRLRTAIPAQARAEFEQVFDAVSGTRPGLYTRSPDRWGSVLADEEFDRRDDGRLRSILAEDDGGVRGYALFKIKRGFTDHDVPEGEVRLIELFAVDPAAYALLWRHVLDRDLCSRVYAWNRPIDDPIQHLIAEPRNLNAGTLDELWARVVDLPAALTARAYAAPAELVIEVADEPCPWNAGRWRLVTAKGTCERTDDAPDLSLPVQVLGASYFGGRSLMSYGAAGLVTEHRPGALRELSTAMSWDPKPWAGLVF